MIERPVLFSAPMVKALIAETKTQTRRLINPQPFEDGELIGHAKLCGLFGAHVFGPCLVKIAGSPYGAVGDRLWVRETWYCDNFTERDFARARVGHISPRTDEQIIAEWRESMYYRADTESGVGKVCELIPECQCEGQSPWKPGIHMPRWASRIELEVTKVRAERLQAITEQDAKAEGVEPMVTVRKVYPSKHAAEIETTSYRDGFRRLWDEINGERAAWALNPWVWVVDFKLAELRE